MQISLYLRLSSSYAFDLPLALDRAIATMTLAKTRLAPVEEDREESHDLLTEKIVTQSRPLGYSIRSNPTCWCIAIITFQLLYGGLIYYLAHETPPTRTCLKGNEGACIIYSHIPTVLTRTL